MQQNPILKASTFTFQFGQAIPTQNNIAPLDISINVGLDSQKMENIKFNFSEFLKKNIPQNSFLIELIAKNGDGIGLADKINSKQFSQVNLAKQMGNITTFQAFAAPKSQKAYILIESDQAQQIINNCSQFLGQGGQLSNHHEAQIRIQSQNGFQTIKKLLIANGPLRGLFDSLQVQLKVRKTQQLTALLTNIISMVTNQPQNNPFTSLLERFEHSNLLIKCQSSKFLQEFQNWVAFQKSHPWQQHQADSQDPNSIYYALKDFASDQTKVYLFGTAFNLTINLNLQESQILFRYLSIMDFH